MPFPVPRCSGDTGCLASTLSRLAMHLIHLPSPGSSVYWVHHEATVSGVLCVSTIESSFQAVTFLTVVNSPGSQEDVVSNWQPAQFGARCGLWGQDCSSPLSCSFGFCTPASLLSGRKGPIRQVACFPLVFAQSFAL